MKLESLRVLGFLAGVAVTVAVHAQGYPLKPIRWIVPIAAGGTNDVASRLIAANLSQALGQQVIVENRPGAASIIGFDAAAKSAPDGYTIVSADNALILNGGLYKSLPYDPERDFEPIALYGRIPMLVVVRASLAVKDVGELIEMAKAQPGKLTFGSAGKGSPHHLVQELFKQKTGTDFIHVPFKGGAPAIVELAAGRLDVGISNFGSVAPHVEAGRLRLLGLTSAQRLARQPQVPTLKEAGGPDMDVAAWQGVLAPKGTAKAIVDRLNQEVVTILRMPRVIGTLAENGVQATPSSPDEFAAFIRSERALWEPLIRTWNIALD